MSRRYTSGGTPTAAGLTLAGDVTGTDAASIVSAISGATPIVVTPVTIRWKESTATPTLDQAIATTANNGALMTIKAQSAKVAGAGNGGGLKLQSGALDGAGANGAVQLFVAATQKASVGGATGDFLTLGALPDSVGSVRLEDGANARIAWASAAGVTGMSWIRSSGNTLGIFSQGDIQIYAPDQMEICNNGGTVQWAWNFSNGGTHQWAVAASAAGFNLIQSDLTTNAGTGGTLTIRAQNETGTTSVGGALALTSGTGTTNYGDVQINGPLVGGFFTAAMANAPLVMTAAQSIAGVVEVTSAAFTANRALTVSRAATNGTMLWVRNNASASAFGVTVQFLSGTATAAILPGTSALISVKAGNAFIVMSGT